jgi:glycosyltransferase involved in cell wall biosynthesis
VTIELVLTTFNRLHYTKLALASILADPSEEFSLTIWDNASADGTVEYLKNEVQDSRITDIIFSNRNVGQTSAVNEIWARSKADLVGKVDNDCLVTPGWTRMLAEAHKDIDKLGVIACWHFFPKDFDYEKAEHKIQRFGNHQIFCHPWTCGAGLLIKRETFKKMGRIEKSATTGYWLKMAAAGYINGFYYPLIYQEHMDDPRSEHCSYRTASFDEAYKHSYGYQTGVATTIEEYTKLHEDILENLLTGPIDPLYYCGWQAKCRRVAGRVKNGLYALRKFTNGA